MKIYNFSIIKFYIKNNCIKCHNFFKKNLNPSFFNISKIYKNNIFYKNILFKKIKYGSNKNINKFLMPQFLFLKNIKIFYLIKWILNIKY